MPSLRSPSIAGVSRSRRPYTGSMSARSVSTETRITGGRPRNARRPCRQDPAATPIDRTRKRRPNARAVICRRVYGLKKEKGRGFPRPLVHPSPGRWSMLLRFGHRGLLGRLCLGFVVTPFLRPAHPLGGLRVHGPVRVVDAACDQALAQLFGERLVELGVPYLRSEVERLAVGLDRLEIPERPPDALDEVGELDVLRGLDLDRVEPHAHDADRRRSPDRRDLHGEPLRVRDHPEIIRYVDDGAAAQETPPAAKVGPRLRSFKGDVLDDQGRIGGMRLHEALRPDGRYVVVGIQAVRPERAHGPPGLDRPCRVDPIPNKTVRDPFPDGAVAIDPSIAPEEPAASQERIRGVPRCICRLPDDAIRPVSYTHLRAHETRHDLVCR